MLVLVSISVWLLGLCIGSFLNVVVYRLPRGLSVASPRRSFCPACGRTIAAKDNVPVWSWLRLRGRCRDCGAAISTQYPLVESVTGMLFVLVFHLLVVAPRGEGAEGAEDYAGVAAWLVLTAAMVACSAMDIVSYSISAAVTDLCIVLGVLLHALSLADADGFRAAADPLTGGGVAAACTGLLTAYVRSRRAPAAESGASCAEAGVGAPGALAGAAPAVLLGARVAICVSAVLSLGGVALAGWSRPAPALVTLLAACAIATVFITLVVAGGQRREADAELHAAIARESPRARHVALVELAWLSPAIVAGLAGVVVLTYWPAAAVAWRGVTGVRVGPLGPVSGAALAVQGAVIAAAAGWLLRIGFTLVFGREAFGTGDIFILAAAGACAGWEIAIIGLGFSIGLALLGWSIGLVMKSTEMIPFGPWLALGFVTALWLRQPVRALVEVYVEGLKVTWERAPNLLYVMAGVLLVGGVGAVAAARLLRRWLERAGGERAQE